LHLTYYYGYLAVFKNTLTSAKLYKMQKLFTLLFLLCSIASFGQTITIKGKITDNQDFALESATIYLTTIKDSAVIDYTISNKNGMWEIKTKKITTPVFLKVSYVGLANYKEEFKSLEEDKDFGTTKLADMSTELSEVVIQSEIPPIRIKKDTLEFNAASFKTRPDANVESLLKQLPGVNIDSDGKITVNGKEVNQILVNGKPFFDKDGQIAIKNLPAEIIEKVQVSDTKTKKEELSGKNAAGDNSSINLTIKKDKNKGFFGKVMGGYGSDERYESSAIVNYFKNKMKVSLLASSNNINASGFSLNEIFDSMGGGRNSGAVSLYMNSGAGNGSSTGITRSDLVGVNYADEWFKGFDASASYNYTGSNTENNNRTSSVNFLITEDPNNSNNTVDNSYTINSESRSKNDRYTNTFNTDFQYKIDSTSTLHFAPKFVNSNSKSSNSSSRLTQRLTNEQKMNESTSDSYGENNSNTFSNQLTYFKQFTAKKGRGISVSLTNSNSKNDDNTLNKSNTIKYSYPNGTEQTKVDNRDQTIYTKSTDDSYNLGIEYTEPVTDSLEVNIGGGYDYNKSINDRKSYNFNADTGDYTTYSDSLSNYLTSETGTFQSRAGISFTKGKWYVNAGAGTNVTSFKNHALFIGDEYDLNKDYILPAADMNLRYNIAKGKSFSVNYNYTVDFPQARQVLPIVDKTNPLNTVEGNPDLDPNKSHRIRIGYRNFDFATRSGYSIWLTSTLYDSQVVQSTVTDTSGINYTRYRNIAGTMSNSISTNWNKSIKKDAHTYRYGISMSAGYNIDKGLLNGIMYDSKSIRLSPGANFTYEYGELLTISPSYNYVYNQYNYTNYRVSSNSNYVHRINLQTTSYWPKHVVFGNDFGYTYNSNLNSGFRKDFYLWNTSVGYNFLKDQLLLKVKVYDVLNQNLGTSRTISPTAITDQENTVLRRYVMFSLTFKLQQFGGAPAKRERNFDMRRRN